MIPPISLQSKRIATMALAPRARASRHIRCRAWLRLSAPAPGAVQACHKHPESGRLWLDMPGVPEFLIST